jgi:hypothetical protein
MINDAGLKVSDPYEHLKGPPLLGDLRRSTDLHVLRAAAAASRDKMEVGRQPAPCAAFSFPRRKEKNVGSKLGVDIFHRLHHLVAQSSLLLMHELA